jgi:hypothetical protein
MRERSFPRKLRVLERTQIARCLSGQRLACGCLAGRYLTYSDHVLVVIDADADGCALHAHHIDDVIGESPAEEPHHADL